MGGIITSRGVSFLGVRVVMTKGVMYKEGRAESVYLSAEKSRGVMFCANWNCLGWPGDDFAKASAGM